MKPKFKGLLKNTKITIYDYNYKSNDIKLENIDFKNSIIIYNIKNGLSINNCQNFFILGLDMSKNKVIKIYKIIKFVWRIL